jgi:tetratricopeptide (TPR) repeat protein
MSQQNEDRPAAEAKKPGHNGPAAKGVRPAPPGKQWMSVDDALGRTHKLLNAGRLQPAESLVRQIVKAKPRHADARNLLSVVLHRLGKHDEAMRSAREAIRLNPKNSNYYCNLGEMERQAGQLDSAAVALRKAIEIDPGCLQAYNNMGIVHYDRREFKKAAECYRKAISINPHYAEAYNNLGNALRASVGHREAIVEYEHAIEARENYAEAYNNMGIALREMQRFEESELSFRRAVDIRPSYVEATNNLANLLIFQKRYEDALRLLGDLLKLHPNEPKTLTNVARTQLMRGSIQQAERAVKAILAENPDHLEALVLYGQICHDLDRFDAAIDHLEHALAMSPNDIDALNHYGIVLKSVGRLDDAHKAFIKALELQPRALGTYSNIGDLEKFTKDNPLFKAMTQIIEKAKEPEDERFMALHFALGKAYDDVGEGDKAFEHYSIGTRLKRAQLKYEEPEVFKFFDEIRGIFSAEFFKNPPFEGNPSEKPLFIIGMPRSGSTLTEQIIQSHPDVYGAGEIKTLSGCIGQLRLKFPSLAKFPAMVPMMRPSQFSMVANNYLKAISAYSETAKRVTDKLLTNYYFAGFIHALYPKAKIIHTMRNPVDSCLSCFTKLFKDDMPHSYDLKELGRYYSKYWELMAHWRAVLPPGTMLDVQYESVVDDPETKAREIIAFIGLEWDPKCLKFHESDRPVKTASVSQIRTPIFKTSVGRWRRYGDKLNPLIDALKEGGVDV